MKKKIILTICFAFVWLEFLPIAALSVMPPADDPYIPIAIVVPRQAEPLDDAQFVRLGNKMLEYATRSGISASAGSSPIAMLPNIAIGQEDVVEGGMKNITVLDADITFLIKNMETGVIYSSISKRVRGSGTNRERALNNCISNISLQQAEFADFVNRGRDKITDYYRANCSSLLAKAETCAKTQQYEEAIALIASIPSTAGCYTQSLAILEKFYPAYQQYNCETLLNRANTLWSGHHYQDALTVLYDLKTFGTDCNKEVTDLTAAIESRLTDNEMREWRLLEEKLRTKAWLEEKRLEVIRDIGVAYYGRTVFNNYTCIVQQQTNPTYPVSPAYSPSQTTVNQNITIVKMSKNNGGTYNIPCKINGVEMMFTFDSGAFAISMSRTEADFLIKQGKLSQSDVTGSTSVQIADGSTTSKQVVVSLKTVEIGNRTLRDVKAVIMDNQTASLLLGQSVLERFGKVSIDYNKNEITFE